jgi:hypothetical protein
VVVVGEQHRVADAVALAAQDRPEIEPVKRAVGRAAGQPHERRHQIHERDERVA